MFNRDLALEDKLQLEHIQGDHGVPEFNKQFIHEDKMPEQDASMQHLIQSPEPDGGKLVTEPVVKEELTPELLIQQAIIRNVPVDVMERLLAMREKLNAEKAKKAYDSAMAQFQSECPEIQKLKEVKTKGGVVAYKYAPIESIVAQVKDLLQKHGFSYAVRMQVEENGSITSTCIVKHTEGHSEEYSMTVPLGNKTEIMSQSQVTAAASTFAKRYAFCNAFGIMTGDEDNDARPMQQRVKTVKATPVAEKPAPRQATDRQRALIIKLIEEKGISVTEAKAMHEKFPDPSGLIEHLINYSKEADATTKV